MLHKNKRTNKFKNRIFRAITLDVLLSCFSFHSFDFQPVYAGGSPNRDRDSPPANVFGSGVLSPPRSPC
jgi:hypothetical protein